MNSVNDFVQVTSLYCFLNLSEPYRIEQPGFCNLLILVLILRYLTKSYILLLWQNLKMTLQRKTTLSTSLVLKVIDLDLTHINSFYSNHPLLESWRYEKHDSGKRNSIW